MYQCTMLSYLIVHSYTIALCTHCILLHTTTIHTHILYTYTLYTHAYALTLHYIHIRILLHYIRAYI